MELGDFGIRWIKVVPEFGGNRDLPSGQRLSLEIERMRTAEVMAMSGNDEEKNRRWLESEKVVGWVNDSEFGPTVQKYDSQALATFRQFVEHTRNHRHFCFEGLEATDPVEIFLKSPFGLTNEITLMIVAASRLSGGDLKKFVALCDGFSGETDVPPVNQEGGRAGPANTQEAPTGP